MIFIDSDEDNTGYQLAKYIADKNIDAEIILHTLNPHGADRMQAVHCYQMLNKLCVKIYLIIEV